MNLKSRLGFSLVELSIVLVVSSVILGHLISFATEKEEENDVKITKKRIEIIEDAISTFLFENDRIVCPASAKHGIFAKRAGFENMDASGVRCVGTKPNPYDQIVETPFAIGVVPTKTLGIPDEFALDAWGRHFTFVTVKFCSQKEELGVSRFFKSADGVCGNNLGSQIRVRDFAQNFISQDAAYIIVSHGKNGHGAILKKGANQRIIPNFKSEDELLNANLDEEGEFKSNEGVFVQRSLFPKRGPKYFDDIVSYKTRNQLIQSANGIIKDGSYLSYLCKIADKIDNVSRAGEICGPDANVNCANYLNELAREIKKICY